MVDRVIEEHRDQIRSHPMGEKWFREWSRSTCEFQGFEPGTEDFRNCQRQQVKNALSTTARAAAVRPAATIRAAFVRGRRR